MPTPTDIDTLEKAQRIFNEMVELIRENVVEATKVDARVVDLGSGNHGYYSPFLATATYQKIVKHLMTLLSLLGIEKSAHGPLKLPDGEPSLAMKNIADHLFMKPDGSFPFNIKRSSFGESTGIFWEIDCAEFILFSYINGCLRGSFGFGEQWPSFCYTGLQSDDHLRNNPRNLCNDNNTKFYGFTKTNLRLKYHQYALILDKIDLLRLYGSQLGEEEQSRALDEAYELYKQVEGICALEDELKTDTCSIEPVHLNESKLPESDTLQKKNELNALKKKLQVLVLADSIEATDKNIKRIFQDLSALIMRLTPTLEQKTTAIYEKLEALANRYESIKPAPPMSTIRMIIVQELKKPCVISKQDLLEIANQCRNWQESIQEANDYYYGYIALNVLCWGLAILAAVTLIGLYVDYKIMSQNDKIYANPWLFYPMNDAHQTRKKIHEFTEEFQEVGQFLAQNLS